MKRHRDLVLNGGTNADYAPIPTIVTTLALHLYGGEPDVYTALTAIVSKLHGHAGLVEDRMIEQTLASLGLIQRTGYGKWYIGNPVNPAENFADLWHEDNHARARAFFRWVDALQEDLVDILAENRLGTAKNRLVAALGASAAAGHLGLITLTEAAANPARVNIGEAARPWRPYVAFMKDWGRHAGI